MSVSLLYNVLKLQITLFNICLIITCVLGILPILYYLYCKSKFKQDISPIVPFLWLTLIGTLYEIIVSIGMQIPAKYWFKIYLLLEFLFLLYLFKSILQKKYTLTSLFFTLTFTGIFSYAIYNFHTIYGLKTDGYISMVTTLFFYTLFFLWSKENYPAQKKMSALRIFLFSFLLYYSITILLFLFVTPLYFQKIYKIQELWIINILATILQRILILTALWKGLKTSN